MTTIQTTMLNTTNNTSKSCFGGYCCSFSSRCRGHHHRDQNHHHRRRRRRRDMRRRHENNENNNKRLVFLFFLVFLVFATRTQRTTTTTTTTVFDGEAERENQTPETRREGVFLKGSRSGEDWRGGLEWREKSREMFTRPRERVISERNSRERATRFVYDVRRRGGKGRFRVHHDIVANCNIDA